MPRIQALSRSVINQIAAGEVLERPASAVKELVENSIDALATRIEVDVAAGGSELIRIVDDGEGIHPEDLPLAVTSHATSKIRQTEELFDIRTFGFRGEALASVAEVSRLRIRSRMADQPHGAELEVDYGTMSAPQVCGCPLGTSIEIRDLFGNIPVRKKFLKSVATEFGQISEQFTRIAIGHPRLHLVLRHNDRVVYQLPAVDRPIDRLQAFFGEELTDQLIAVDSQHAGIRLWGYVGHPSVSKATRKQQYLFLNGRWIQDRTLQHALTEAYRGLLMVGRQPVSFLFLEMPTDRVDVNVHPTKSEVRFQDSQQLFRQVLSTLRSKFLSLDLQSKLTVPAGATSGALSATLPELSTGKSSGELQTEFADWAKEQLQRWTPDTPPALRHAADAGLDDEPEVASTAIATTPPDWTVRGRHDFPTSTVGPASWGSSAHTDQKPDDDTNDASSPGDFPEGFVPPEFATESSAAATMAPAGISPLRAMQIHDCYIVVETEDGMTVIDQHALHERILYEHFRARVLAGAVESQRLLMPVPVEVTAKEASLLTEHGNLLSQLGLGIEEFGRDTVVVTRHPVLLGRIELLQLVRDLAEKLDGSPGSGPTRRDLLDELLHMMSCKAAVKAGQRLSPEEIDSLLQQRHLVDDAHHCPHGRPTALKLSRTELDRQFGRLG